MRIQLKSKAGHLAYEGTNERGQTVQLSGDGDASSPMETVLMAGAACSAIDVELILTKMKAAPEGVEVRVEGIQAEDAPRVFQRIDLHYVIIGDVPAGKAERSLQLSIEKYCSVLLMLRSAVEVHYTYELRPSVAREADATRAGATGTSSGRSSETSAVQA